MQPARVPPNEHRARPGTQSETRLRSARHAAIEVSEVEIHSSELEDIANEERPTLVPDEAVSESLEARLLFETRAEEERRLSQASRQDERPTARVEAKRTLVGLSTRDLPPPPSVRWEPPIEVEEDVVVVRSARQIVVRVIGVLLLLGIVAAILTPIVTRNWRAIQRGLVTLTSRA